MIRAWLAKDRAGPKIRYQVLLIPATDANIDTKSYQDYADSRFRARDFVLLNGIRNVAGTRAALDQMNDEIKRHLKQ